MWTAYRVLQRQLRGGDNKPVSDKAINAFLFVIEQADERREIPSWEEVRKRWNKRYPEQPYERREDLYRAYQYVRKVLLPVPPTVIEYVG